ncbi:MAG: hypothetical protein AVDCRST_MAG91-2806 [uncultured Sphingomonadaceae bacterium]|uniref:Uncharacterized protein n=1 Tax=uncultured Sphingomonadaceae bacterium TaxID=169976 RepID=A0A6J4TS77_9SPHN|nr:MAG: hypothetical protein AVDCRST_MAG91-2806 [uncultured Sphingomonadaceae bacterium]
MADDGQWLWSVARGGLSAQIGRYRVHRRLRVLHSWCVTMKGSHTVA